MRVIAGQARGRRLKGLSVRAPTARPSSGLVRGAVFSALGSMGAEMTRVLDLYAGSGALGIEALSRGAKWCDFVERDATSCTVIRENLRVTGFQGQGRVHRLLAERVVERLPGPPYTLILADPPYADVTASSVLERLAESPLIETGRSILMLECGAREEPPDRLGMLNLGNLRRHGDSMIAIYG